MSQTLDTGRLISAPAPSSAIRQQIEGLKPVLAVEDHLAWGAGKLGRAFGELSEVPGTLTMFWPEAIEAVVWRVPVGDPASEAGVRNTLEPFFMKFVQGLQPSGAADLEMPSGGGLPRPAGMTLGRATFGDVTVEVDDAGIARLAGMHVRVSQIALERALLGSTPEQIRANHPHLSLRHVYVALAAHGGSDVIGEAQSFPSPAGAEAELQNARMGGDENAPAEAAQQRTTRSQSSQEKSGAQGTEQGAEDVAIEVDDKDVARLVGTRIKVAQIALEQTRLGLTPEQIRAHHPHLSPGQVYVALDYYYDHRDVVEAQIAASLAWADRAREEAGPSPLLARLQAQGRLPVKRAA